jgi:hypothetical protein
MQGADDELRRAMVISMVPAAPLLPTTEPVRSAVGHWLGVAEEVEVVETGGDVVPGEWLVVDVDDPAGRVVVGVDVGPDEHPASTAPTAPTATSAVTAPR